MSEIIDTADTSETAEPTVTATPVNAYESPVVIARNLSLMKSRRDISIMGAQLFAMGTFIAILVFSTASLMVHFESVEFHAIVLFAYIAIPLAAALGACCGYRTCKLALDAKVPQVSTAMWAVSVLFFRWFTLLYYFSYKLRQTVLENNEQRLWPAGVYFLIMAAISLALGAGHDRLTYLFLTYSLLAAWFGCDVLLVNLLRTLRNTGELAPLTAAKFQFTLGTLLTVMLAGGGWVTGLVMMLRR